jgi:hypothetical protein
MFFRSDTILMQKPKDNNLTLILIIIGLIVVAWLFYTGLIWYIIGVGVVLAVAYGAIKIHDGNKEKTKDVFVRPKKSSQSAQRTIIKEKEIIKERVMIPCEYCRSLMSQTVNVCPICGARRKG